MRRLLLEAGKADAGAVGLCRREGQEPGEPEGESGDGGLRVAEECSRVRRVCEMSVCEVE